jgi:hypothetical protein
MNATSVYAAMLTLQAKHIEEKKRSKIELARLHFKLEYLHLQDQVPLATFLFLIILLDYFYHRTGL